MYCLDMTFLHEVLTAHKVCLATPGRRRRRARPQPPSGQNRYSGSVLIAHENFASSVLEKGLWIAEP